MCKVLPFIIAIISMFLPCQGIAQPNADPVPLLKKSVAFAKINQTDSLVESLYPVRRMLFSAENRANAQPYLDTLQNILGSDAPAEALITLYIVLNEANLNAGDYDAAIDFSEKATFLQKNLPEPDPIEIGMSLTRTAENYWRKGDLAKASEKLKEGVEFLEQSGDVNNKAMYNLCYFSGIMATEREHLHKAIDWFSQANSIALNVFGKKHSTYATGFLTIGNIYSIKGEFEKALQYHRQALDNLLEIAGPDHPEISPYFANLARDYAQLGQNEKAEIYFNKTLEAETRIFGPGHPSTAFTNNNIGKSALDQGKLDLAKIYLEKSLDLFLATMGGSNAYIPEVYNNLGKLYFESKELDRAIDYFQKAIDSNTGEVTGDPLETPLPGTYFHPLQLIKSLMLKNEALLSRFEINRDEDDLIAVLNNIKKGDNLIGHLRQAHIGQQDLISFNQTANNFYQQAIDANYIFNTQSTAKQIPEQAFLFSEKNKSIALLKAVKSTQALHFSGIADSLLEKENNLKKELANLEDQLIDPKKEDQSKSIQEKYFSIKKEYADIIKQFETQYPKYYDLKYDLEVESVSQIQQYLQKNNAALIEYSMADEHLFVFLITPNDFNVWKKPVRNLSTEILNFRNDHFTEKALSSSTPVNFASDAHVLYKILLADPLNSLDKNTSNLIIVPDGALAYLPFDVLVEKMPEEKNGSFASLSYLMNRFNCSYAWSATLLLNQVYIPKNKFANNYAGFAPAYDPESNQLLDSLEFARTTSLVTRSGWNDLPAARNSVQTISGFLKGIAYISESANKANFFSSISDSRILHLAMHGFLDDNDPLYSGFAFGNNKAEEDQLFAWELYNMDIPAELAVLSACQSGVGELKKGEGLMSLSRAFTYAGCPSVVMSLWNIPDEASADIIVDFHKILNEGKPKDEALKNAKLNYLNNSQLPPERLHPFFWAGFIQTGDTAAINFEKTFFNGSWGIGFLILLLIFGLIWMRRKG